MQLSDFPIFSSSIGDRNREKIVRAVALIHEGITAGEIANAVFVSDIKDYLGRALERAWRTAIQERYDYNQQARPLTDDERKLHYDLPLHPEAHKIGGMIRKIEKSGVKGEYAQAMLDFLNEVAPLCDAYVRLKSMTKKRVVKSPEERKVVYTAPKTSTKAEAAILKVLRDVTDSSHEALQAAFVDMLNRCLQKYLTATREPRSAAKYGHLFVSPHDFFMGDDRPVSVHGIGERQFTVQVNKDHYAGTMVSRCTHQASGKVPYERRQNADEIIAAEALLQANAAREAFITKNMLKLVSITESKGDFDKIEIVTNSVNLTTMTGVFRVTFRDGASFVTQIQTVWHLSTRGLPFFRVPVTFHNVVFGNGQKMKSPSEQKMNEAFARAA
jgi:hypothetical protein